MLIGSVVVLSNCTCTREHILKSNVLVLVLVFHRSVVLLKDCVCESEVTWSSVMTPDGIPPTHQLIALETRLQM